MVKIMVSGNSIFLLEIFRQLVDLIVRVKELGSGSTFTQMEIKNRSQVFQKMEKLMVGGLLMIQLETLQVTLIIDT